LKSLVVILRDLNLKAALFCGLRDGIEWQKAEEFKIKGCKNLRYEWLIEKLFALKKYHHTVSR
jgi:hypothetical protein